VALERAYERSLRWALHHRPLVVAMLLGSLLAGVVAGPRADFVTSEDRSEFNVFLELPLGSTIHQTLEVSQRVEDEIRRHPEVRIVFATVGGGQQKRVNEAHLYVGLTHKTLRRMHQDAVMADVRARLDALDQPISKSAVERISGSRSRARAPPT
jgi:multidrug efflux pump subunit AcrB